MHNRLRSAFFFVFLEFDHLATTQGLSFSTLAIMMSLKLNCLATIELSFNSS